LERLVSAELSEARHCRTAASATAWLAIARASVASAVSSSVLEGTFPPDSSATWRRRARLASDSWRVALAWSTTASAEDSVARALTTESWSFEMSRRARTCPFST